MNIVRKMTVGLLVSLLGASLFATAWANVGASTIRNQEAVKSWFIDSGFYTKIDDIVIDTLKSDSKSSADSSGGLQISDPAVQKVIKDAISPEFLKTNIDTSLDSIYSWLRSNEPDLKIKIDLSSLKENIASGLSSYAVTRSVGLPVCGAVGNNSPIDPFTATCLPRGVTPVQVGALASQQFSSQDFLKDPILTADNLKIKDKEGNSVPITHDARVKTLRKVYKLGGSLLLVLGALSVLFAVGIIFLSKNRLSGINKVATVLLTTGVILGVLYAGMVYLFKWANESTMKTNPGPTAQVTLGIDFAKVVLQDIERILLIYAVAYVTLGIGVLVLSHILKKRDNPEKPQSNKEKLDPDSEEKMPEAEISNLPENKPAQIERPKPKPPRKIQL